MSYAAASPSTGSGVGIASIPLSATIRGAVLAQHAPSTSHTHDSTQNTAIAPTHVRPTSSKQTPSTLSPIAQRKVAQAQREKFNRTAPLPAVQQPQPIPIDPKGSVVISTPELYHMFSLTSTQSPQIVSSHRQSLRELSQSRYKNWGNTLEALREKKKLDRIKQLEEIEKKQLLIDEEESHYREAQRKVIINRANRLLWQDVDRVKNLQSGILLANVMKERELQNELKKQKEEQIKEREKLWALFAEEDRKKALEIQSQEETRRQQERKKLAEMQLSQLQEDKMRKEVERLNDVEEGERIKKMTQQYMQEAKEEEERRQEVMKLYNVEYKRANERQLLLKQEKALMEKREEEKIEKFAKEKERLIQLRKEHENARFQAKQARFEKMLKAQFDHLLNIKNMEHKRVERQVQELQQKEEDKRAKEKERMTALLHDLQLQREAQRARKAADKERQRVEEETMYEEWRKNNEKMRQFEQDVEQRMLKKNYDMQEEVKKQIVAKEETLRRELQREQEEALAMRDARQREDAVFDQYAQNTLAELEARGKSTLPLKLCLTKDKLIQEGRLNGVV